MILSGKFPSSVIHCLALALFLFFIFFSPLWRLFPVETVGKSEGCFYDLAIKK